MVSNRCKEAARVELKKLGLHFIVVDLGEVEIMEDITNEQRQILAAGLRATGLELMDDHRAVLIEKIIDVISEMIDDNNPPGINYSELLHEKLGYEYKWMAALFMEMKGITIQHYIIVRKTERAKEFLMRDNLSIADIAFKLHYSSSAHLSNQFKKITGLTLLEYKKLKPASLKRSESYD